MRHIFLRPPWFIVMAFQKYIGKSGGEGALNDDFESLHQTFPGSIENPAG